MTDTITATEYADAVYSGRNGEKRFQATVEGYLRVHGWCWYHSWSSMHSRAGFPDLVAVRGDRLLFAELKVARGKVSADQEAWLTALRASGRCEVYLWYPRDLDEIAQVLA